MNGRCWTPRIAPLTSEALIERIPGHTEIRFGRGLVMTNIVADESARDAKLHVRIKMRVVRRVNLRDQCFETGLVDHEVQVRRPVVVATRGLHQLTYRSIDRDRISRRLHAAEMKASRLVGNKASP